jgi:chaperone BCS1
MNISQVLTDNQFSFQTFLPYVIGLYGVTVLTFLFRSVPRRIIALIKKHCTTTLTFTSSLQDFFIWIMKTFEEENLIPKARSLRFFARPWQDKLQKGIGEGRQMFIFRGKILWVNHIVELLQSGQLHKISITILGREQLFFDLLRNEFDHMVEKETSDTDETAVYVYENSWKREREIKKRSFDTIFLDTNTKKRLTDHLDKFYANEDWYEKRGIPYQTGVLLYGEPGSGKSSIIRSLAGKYNKRLCVIQAAQLSELPKALRTLPSECFVVIEDVDVNMGVHQRKESQKTPEQIAKTPNQISLSEILNAIDGIISVRGRVLFLTTNHIEVLDKAFIRPGRIDLSVDISYASVEAFKDFAKVFYAESLGPNTLVLLDKVRQIQKVTVAQLQNDFMCGMDVERLIQKYCVLHAEHYTIQANDVLAKIAV